MNRSRLSTTRRPLASIAGRLAAGLVLIAVLAAPLHSAAAHPAADGAGSPCNAPSWPALPNLDFGRVDPGLGGDAAERFIVHAGGPVSATVMQGAPVFQVTGMEVYRVSRVLVVIDPTELPHGYKVKPSYQTVCSLDTQVSGTGTLTVKSGELVQVDLAANPAAGEFSPTGTLSLSLGSASIAVPISLFVGGIQASLDASALSLPQGRATDLGVTVSSLGGPDTDATFALYDAVPGITVANPVVHVPSGRTVHTTLHVTANGGAALGDHPYNLAVSAFGGQQTFDVGSLTVTVTPLPTKTLTVPLGAVVDAWGSMRDAACATINDLTGRQVLSFTGRTIRNPDCYLAPLQLTASQTGTTLQLTGSAAGNWESFYATTPDGVPGDLDPKFQVNYDIALSLGVALPTTLGNTSALQVTQLGLAVQNVDLDSHNLTGDLAEAVAKTFGYGKYFHPANYALGTAADQVKALVNSALAPLTSALDQAPKDGFTRIQFSLDPATLLLTATLS